MANVGSPVAVSPFQSGTFSGNKQTRQATLLNLLGVEVLLNRSRGCANNIRLALLDACRQVAAGKYPVQTERQPPSLFDPPGDPAGDSSREHSEMWVPAKVDENLIMAQALEIANRKLEAAKAKHYPPNHLFTATEIGEPFGLAAVSLNKILEKEEIQYSIRREGRRLWVLAPDYRKRGFAWVRDVEKNGRLVSCLLWTWTGKQFIEDVLAKSGFLKKE